MSPVLKSDLAAKDAARQLAQTSNPISRALGSAWHWLNGIASGVSHLIGGPIASALKVIYAAIKDLTDGYHDIIDTIRRLEAWWENRLLRYVLDPIRKQIGRLGARITRDFRYLIALIYITTATVYANAVRLIHAETRARQRAISVAESQARLEIRRVHQMIEREAASGYRLTHDARVTLITRLLDYAGARNPLIRSLVKRVATGVFDLASVDDPFARLLLNFLIKEVINRLGIDKAAGTLVHDLLAPILGQPKPRNIHDVVADMSARLVTLEKFAATFMEDGGSQVEQAGKDWRDITSIAGSAAIVAFVAQGVVAPDLWATELSGTVGRAANDIAAKANTLFRGR